ncbi:MAG: class I SAM-dependent methyltransferase [Rhodobacter sp.]|uniref:class I SAM-dependent methyltransferase n=1 Tax=Pararhodobacter sp. TaxID=2127056 RepID=UPI001DB27BAA|nr:class I SAM-dependent methyltransferase [Pararhodobacter sp.]MCB1344872.1 class I SAM-dependent methyltransferase [Paracoccaceae bacterium]MCC0073301.1 class I SAM-dependent methyltransferase [Rhodobacter sp.]HPD92647.1 class I SAM-dependent methyltransferase [Pararhodobacter sp.]
MSDDETLRVYQARAEDYARLNGDSQALARFMASLPPGARVLDWGCGPGNQAKILLQRGFDVDPVDASAAMIAIARDRKGLPARLARFDDPLPGPYHGAWVSFSLLHAPRADLPRHLRALHDALAPKGVLFLGLKLGTGEGRDALGRFYTYYTRAALLAHLADAGFAPFDIEERTDAGLAGRREPALLILARKIHA